MATHDDPAEWLARHRELVGYLTAVTGDRKAQAYSVAHDRCVVDFERLCETVYYDTLKTMAKALARFNAAVVYAGHPRWGVDVRVTVDRRVDPADGRYAHSWSFRVYVTAEDAGVKATPFTWAELYVRAGFFPFLTELAAEIARLDLITRIE